MNSRTRIKKGKSELRREAIMQNALKIFDRRGFANTSLDDIARETGVKREAIYYYFGNRAEILLNIIRPQSEALVASLQTIAASTVSYRDKLYFAIRNHLEHFDRNCLEMTVSLRDVYLEDAKEVRREMTRIWRAYETSWTQIIAEGQRRGDIARSGDPKMIAFAILGMCNWLARWYDPKKAVKVDELVDTYFSMIGHGLLTTAAREKSNARERDALYAELLGATQSEPATQKRTPAARRKSGNGTKPQSRRDTHAGT
jgi:TetR/AcrR family transcriptional regulator, cholesterol catabolism regulator